MNIGIKASRNSSKKLSRDYCRQKNKKPQSNSMSKVEEIIIPDKSGSVDKDATEKKLEGLNHDPNQSFIQPEQILNVYHDKNYCIIERNLIFKILSYIQEQARNELNQYIKQEANRKAIELLQILNVDHDTNYCIIGRKLTIEILSYIQEQVKKESNQYIKKVILKEIKLLENQLIQDNKKRKADPIKHRIKKNRKHKKKTTSQSFKNQQSIQ